MPIISPKQVVPGTNISAADVNTPINTIANLVNGNLDDDNIVDTYVSNQFANNTALNGSILPRHLAPTAKLYSIVKIGTFSYPALSANTYTPITVTDPDFKSTDIVLISSTSSSRISCTTITISNGSIIFQVGNTSATAGLANTVTYLVLRATS
jgi:hypothetical protein